MNCARRFREPHSLSLVEHRLMRRSCYLLVLGVCACLCVPGPGFSQVVYDASTVPDISNAWEMSGFREAQSFTLSAGAIVDHMNLFTTFQNGQTPDPTWGVRGYFDWSVFTDDGTNAPHAVIASGRVVPTLDQRTILGPGFDESAWDFAVAPTALAANTRYWIEVLNTDSTGSLMPTNFYWLASSSPLDALPSAHWDAATETWIQNPAIDNQYFNYGNRLAFQLTGTTDATTTPEPSAVLLFGTGLVGLALALRQVKTR